MIQCTFPGAKVAFHNTHNAHNTQHLSLELPRQHEALLETWVSVCNNPEIIFYFVGGVFPLLSCTKKFMSFRLMKMLAHLRSNGSFAKLPEI